MNGRGVEIVGTDISGEQVERARAALYTQFEVQRGLLIQYPGEVSLQGGGQLAHHRRDPRQGGVPPVELARDLRPLCRFDVVFCRNVLIYLDQAAKRRALEAITQQMASDGLLYLGGAETVLGITDRFVPVPGEHGVYTPAAATIPARQAVAGVRAFAATAAG